MNKPLLTGALTVAALGVGLVGACLSTGNCQAKPDVATPGVAEAPATLPIRSAVPQKIRWFTSLEAAQKESKRTGKPIFADFYAEWCPPCKMLEAQTYPDPKVIAESQKWVMLKIDTEKHNDLAIKYGISSLPTLAVLRSDGQPITGVGGFLDAGQFVEFLRDGEKKAVVRK